ncbi:MAG: hypothetical protein DMG65_02055 [Candidatus Angelobacter sp. Gp1-AA117]|nr:MAG: hypothetical protein DMG65_02055 [Candidatus Angelobacter sp. Gp1-AA117]
MSENDPKPGQTLALLLGASSFRRAPKLAQGRAFYNSAQDFYEYLTGSEGLRLARENVNWLFDDSRSPSDQLQDIRDFLESRFTAFKNEGFQPQDLILYYVGHGLFSGADHTYCLATRATDERNEGLTSIRASDLASIIRGSTRFVRKFLILDCCFSAAAYKEFQSGPLTAGRTKLLDELPQRGTTLLCSASAQDPSLAPEGLSRTMFSDSLLKALRQGHPFLGPRLSLSELGDLVKTNIQETYPNSWVRPEVHSPDQREGDVASVPLFPNAAYFARKAAEEARQQAEMQRIQEEAESRERAEAQRKAREAEETRRKVQAQRAREEAEARERGDAEHKARETKDAAQTGANQTQLEERLTQTTEPTRVGGLRHVVQSGQYRRPYIVAAIVVALMIFGFWYWGSRPQENDTNSSAARNEERAPVNGQPATSSNTSAMPEQANETKIKTSSNSIAQNKKQPSVKAQAEVSSNTSAVSQPTMHLPFWLSVVQSSEHFNIVVHPLGQREEITIFLMNPGMVGRKEGVGEVKWEFYPPVGKMTVRYGQFCYHSDSTLTSVGQSCVTYEAPDSNVPLYSWLDPNQKSVSIFATVAGEKPSISIPLK